MESAMEMNHGYIDCSNALNRIDLFSEASHREYEINLKEIMLKVLKENGTEEDFDFLATEAAKDYIKRTKKAIEKTSIAVSKFITKCRETLIKLVTQEKTKVAIEKAETACQGNPKLRSEKVEFNNTDKQVKSISQCLDKLRKRVTKVKAKGIATEEDIKFVDEIEDELNGIITSTTDISTVTLATAISTFSKISSKSEIEAVISDDVSDLEITIDESSTQTPETAEFFVNAIGVMGNLKKEKTSKVVAKITSLFDAIAKSIKKKDVTKVETESETKLEDLEMFSYVVESVSEESVEVKEETTEIQETEEVEVKESAVVEGLNLDDYFEKVCNEVFSENAKEETESENMSETYMEQLETEVFGKEEEVVEEPTETPAEEPVEESTEVTDTLDAQTYLEQLESELFGKDDEIVEETAEEPVQESTQEETEEIIDDDAITSLIDEMEKLL
jgi:hypothetical protein